MAIVWFKELGEESRLGIWKIEESEEELKQLLNLNRKEIQYIHSIRNGKRMLHYLASRVLLRKLLNLAPKETLDIRLDDHEKPFIFNKSYHFSITHSFHFAAVFISRDHLVGLDIEQISDKILRIEDKFISREEKIFINPENRIAHLYACWSAKEAVYKIFGKKTISFKDHIGLHPFVIQNKGEIIASLHKGQFFKNFRVFYEVFEGYMLAYVMD